MRLTRRRFLTISAAAVALPGVAHAGAARWTGWAMGAAASMTLAGVSPEQGAPVFAEMEAELDRLENIFSLYRPNSALSRLNLDGALPAPPPELLEVLSLCDTLYHLSGGAFDPTVQPLWQALANDGNTNAARSLIGWNGVRHDAGAIRMARPGMALTLNGIAQGYVTDRVAGLLRARGFSDILVDIGEIAAHGAAPDTRPWTAKIAAPGGQIVHRVELRDRALATSAPAGTLLPGGQGHILGPTGQAAHRSLVTVSAPTAALADGLSTALCLLDVRAGHRAVAGIPGAVLEFAA